MAPLAARMGRASLPRPRVACIGAEWASVGLFMGLPRRRPPEAGVLEQPERPGWSLLSVLKAPGGSDIDIDMDRCIYI